MDKVIKDRIDTVNNHRTPLGYYRTKDIGLAPTDWVLGIMSDVVTPIKRAVPKPDKPYWRLGIKSWAKGTFRAYVDQPETVDMDELYEVHENDLVVNITFAWEHAIAVAAKDDQGLLVSHRFPTYEFKDNQVPNFYKSVISQKLFKDMLEHISPGGAGRNRVLNQKDFLNLPCYIPSFSEQEKISEILDHYDKLIKLCEAKLNEYKSLKKTCLSKMFPRNGSTVPELRFPEFTGVWEQRKALELAEYSKGNGYSKGDLAEVGTPIILYGRLYTKYQFAIDEVDTFTTPKSGSVYSQGNEVIVPASGETAEDIARASAVEKSGILLGGDLNILRPFDCINPRFLALAISNGEPQKELAKKAQGKSVVHIHNSDIQEVTISYPLRAEQDRIVAVFRHLDHLITLHQREVEEYTRLKKAMTQLLLTGIVRVKM